MKPTLAYSHGAVVFPPHLALLIGVNEAIVFQRIIWLCEESGFGRVVNGRRWMFNTPEGWQYWFPFFSQSTIRRTLEILREMHLLDAEQFDGSTAPMFYAPAQSADVALKRLAESRRLDECVSNLPSSTLKMSEQHAQIEQAPTEKVLAQIEQQTERREIPTKRERSAHADFDEQEPQIVRPPAEEEWVAYLARNHQVPTFYARDHFLRMDAVGWRQGGAPVIWKKHARRVASFYENDGRPKARRAANGTKPPALTMEEAIRDPKARS